MRMITGVLHVTLSMVLGTCLLASCQDGPPAQPSCEYVPQPARSFRLFAVGHHIRVEDVVSVQSFKDSIRATVEQDVVPNLASDRPNVLVFPESITLAAFFTGSRGAAARGAESTGEAFSSLFDTYGDVFRFYSNLDRLQPLQRLLMSSPTDVVWRATHDTFSEIAREYGVYVVTGSDVGDVEVATDPEIIDVVGDPDRPEGSPVYWLPEIAVYNQALFYGPDGELFDKVRKEYLTDMEIGSLSLNAGLPERLGPVSMGDFSKATALISRDAWMQPALDRMALQGADSVHQLEAFAGGWGFGGEGASPWNPDNLKRSSWSAVQKYPEIRSAVAPMLVGNFFDIVFDGQSFAVVPGTPQDTRLALMAQEPDTGWAAIAPWVADEIEGSLEERRAALRPIAESLKTGGARENEYVQGTVYVDVDIPADDGHPIVSSIADGGGTALGASTAVAPIQAGRQRNVSAAVLPDGTLVAVWEDSGYCTEQVVSATSSDGGMSWSEPVRVAPWNRAQRSPSLAVNADGHLLVAWQEVDSPDRAQIRVARSRDAGASFEKAVVIDEDQSVNAWTPSLAVDAVTGDVHLVYVDARLDADGNSNWRVYYERSRDGGVNFESLGRLDPRQRGPLDEDRTYTNEWSPHVAAHGERVIVTYTHRQRPQPEEQPSIDVFTMESTDSGTTFGAPLPMDTGGSPERISADLDIAINQEGRWQAVWAGFRGSGDDADILLAHESNAISFAPDAQPRRYQWLPSIASLGEDWVVVWQDFREGSNDIYLARYSEGGGFGEALRIDDGGSSAAQSWRPEIVVHEERVHVFWEDSRSGFASIRVATGTLPAAP